MTRTELLQAADEWFHTGELRRLLAARVAYQTESDLGAAPPALDAYLRDEIAPYLVQLGFNCQILANPASNATLQAGPFLVAHRIENAALPTVFIYAHGDVINGQSARWRAGLSPWALVEEGDRWFGRGTADNKGQHTITLAGLGQVITAKAGKLGYNVTLLMETGEEAGSPGLADFCRIHRELLSADLMLASDGPRIKADQPTIFLGSRGLVNFSLQVQSREKAYHSGNWGGVLQNPATRLAHALSSLVDAQGRMQVAALKAPPMDAATQRALASIAIGTDPEDPTVDPCWGEAELTPAQRLMGANTLEVLALGCGSADRPINAIQPSAVAHCQLRFVVGTDWQHLQSHVRAHLVAHGFDDISVDVRSHSVASRLDMSNPWVQWAADSITRSTGKTVTILPNLAGSLPNDVFADILGLPTVWVPHSYPACNQHAPNEHLLKSVAQEGLRMMAGLFWDLGERWRYVESAQR